MPNYAEAYNFRGLSKYYSTNDSGAIDDFNKAIELKTDFAAAYLNRGNYKYYLGTEADACADWTKASELGDEKAKYSLQHYCVK